MSNNANNGNLINEKLDEIKLTRIRNKFARLVQPIQNAVNTVQKMPFFDWLQDLKSPKEFAPAAIQLYYHSATFPKAMGLMLANTPSAENYMMPYYAEHAFTEASHHQMLMEWMLEHKILDLPNDINQVIPTLATSACINVAYGLAQEADREKWIVTINCGIELCSNYFFKEVAPKMRSLGAEDLYFDIHVEADEYHSIMGLEYIQKYPADSDRQKMLIAKSLEGVSLWAAMIHSWIGINILPQFNLKGELLTLNQPASRSNGKVKKKNTSLKLEYST